MRSLYSMHCYRIRHDMECGDSICGIYLEDNAQRSFQDVEL